MGLGRDRGGRIKVVLELSAAARYIWHSSSLYVMFSYRFAQYRHTGIGQINILSNEMLEALSGLRDGKRVS